MVTDLTIRCGEVRVEVEIGERLIALIPGLFVNNSSRVSGMDPNPVVLDDAVKWRKLWSILQERQSTHIGARRALELVQFLLETPKAHLKTEIRTALITSNDDLRIAEAALNRYVKQVGFKKTQDVVSFEGETRRLRDEGLKAWAA